MLRQYMLGELFILREVRHVGLAVVEEKAGLLLERQNCRHHFPIVLRFHRSGFRAF